MSKDINLLKSRLSDLKSARQKIRQQELDHSLKFIEEVDVLLKKSDNSEYEEGAERLLKSHNQIIELTKGLSENIDKWISDVEAEIKSLE